MRTDCQQRYAALTLRLLLDSNPEVHEAAWLNWDELRQIARRNFVLLRIADRLIEMAIKPSDAFEEAVKDERQRKNSIIDVIRRVSAVCSESNVDYIFAKGFQHYPDMGNDIDLYIQSQSSYIDLRIVTALGASAQKRDLSSRIAGTNNYRVTGCTSPLEIHHGQMGNVGEHRTYLNTVILNGNNVEIEGTEFLVPSCEDQLIIQGMYRVYGRRYIRLCDIVSTVSSIRGNVLDWNYIITTARQLGILDGLCCYLGYMEAIYRDVFEDNLISPKLKTLFVTKGWGRIEFKDGLYRFPNVRVAGKLYFKKFHAAMLAGNWERAGRLCLVPIVTGATLFRRVSHLNMQMQR